MLKKLDFLALLAYCAFIYWLSDQAIIPMPMLFEFQDKVHHFGAYFVMSLLAWRSFRHFGLSGRMLAFISAGFASLYGVSDEIHQSFVEGRTADVFDWVADTLGAVAAMWLLTKFFLPRLQLR